MLPFLWLPVGISPTLRQSLTLSGVPGSSADAADAASASSDAPPPTQTLAPPQWGAAGNATAAAESNATTWLTQMSEQVHHALVEAKALEQRVAAAAATRADAGGGLGANRTNWSAAAVTAATDGGAHGDALLREVTFKPGLMDAGMRAYRRSLLLHELAMSCRLVVVLDDPDPSSRDATFLSMWQLDGKQEPAPPARANGGDGYRKLRLALSGLAWRKHDRAHADFAERYYDGRVDAGFYSTRWYWLSGSHDRRRWIPYDQFANASRPAFAAAAVAPSPPASPPVRFTPPSSPLPAEMAAEQLEAEYDAELVATDAEPAGEGGSGAVALLGGEAASGDAGQQQLEGQQAEPQEEEHVEAAAADAGHAPPVVGMQSLVCYKLIALFKPGELERGRLAMAEALLPEVAAQPSAVAATALHDAELQKLLWLMLAHAPLNLTRIADTAQQHAALAPLLSEPLVAEVYTDAAIYWPGSL